MDRRALAALLVAWICVSATASTIVPAGDTAPAAIAPLGAAGPAVQSTCVWRIAFRAPARLYFGCRWSDTLAASTHWLDLDPIQIGELTAFAAAIARGSNAGPITLGSASSAQQPTLCDRYWLWAEDEGPRAPEMTRERKIRQACAEQRP